MAERLGEIFLKKKVVSVEQLEIALQEQTRTGEFLGEILMRLGFAKEEDLLRALAEQFNTRFVDLSRIRINPLVLKLVPRGLAWEYKFLPIEVRNSVLLIAVSNPLDMWPMSVLQEKLDLAEVQTVLARKEDIMQGIQKYYGPETGAL